SRAPAAPPETEEAGPAGSGLHLGGRWSGYPHLTADDLAGSVHQLQDRASHHALPAAGLADHSQRLTSPDAQADTIDGVHHPVLELELGAQVAQLEDRWCLRIQAPLGSRVTCRGLLHRAIHLRRSSWPGL